MAVCRYCHDDIEQEDGVWKLDTSMRGAEVCPDNIQPPYVHVPEPEGV